MSSIVNFGQMMKIQVRVNLRSANVGVAEHFLDDAQVGDPALVRFDLEKKEISRKTLPGSLRTWVSNRTASIDLMVYSV